MRNFYSPVADILALNVQTLADAERYYREVQGEHFVGLPGVAMSASCFTDSAPELETFRLTFPSAFAKLWVFALPDGSAFITTSLHQLRPGVALSDFLQARLLSDRLQKFLVEWRRMVGAYYALRCLYVPTPEEALEQTAHSAGRN